MRQMKVVVCDPNDITRKGIEAIIEEVGGPYHVVAGFVELAETEDYLNRSPVDVLLLDDQGMTPQEVIRAVMGYKERYPGLWIFLVSHRRDGDYTQTLVNLGSVSFLLKTDLLKHELLKAFQLTQNSYHFISPEAFRLIGTKPLTMLTHRDLEFLRMIAKEMQVKEVSHQLGITTKSGYRIRDKLKRVLGVGNNDTLVDAARKKGLLGPED